MDKTPRRFVDQFHTSRPRAGEAMKDPAQMPGLLLVAFGVVGLAIGIAGFAKHHASFGAATLVVALLVAGAGLGWLGLERRRIHRR